MSRVISFFVFCMFFCHLAEAQTTNFVKGYVVTIKGDTLTGLLKKFNFSAKPSTVAVFMDDKGEKTKYRPSQLKAYKVGTDTYQTKTYRRPGTGVTPIVVFMKVVAEGPVSLYAYFYQSPAAPVGPNGMMTGSSVQKSYYLEKEGYPLFLVKKMKFRKEVSAYLSESPKTVKKINEDKLKYADIRTIVNIYNNDLNQKK